VEWVVISVGGGIVGLLQKAGLSGPRLFVASLGVSGIFLVLSYLIATYPSNKRRR